jgi:hypothetical protein
MQFTVAGALSVSGFLTATVTTTRRRATPDELAELVKLVRQLRVKRVCLLKRADGGRLI